ncbi:hypothetical protein BDZ89DRAFT_1146422 [Hymenopellis radicata]|nr:hypothetical protein BDZ89DRAFT_1146422 [Hymenopellis radicata]
MPRAKNSSTQRAASLVLIVLTDSSDDEDTPVAVSAPALARSPPTSLTTTRNALPPSDDLDNIADAFASLDLRSPDTTLYSISGSGTTTDWYVAPFDMFLAHMTPSKTLSPRKKTRGRAKGWVVFIGRTPGVYRTWPEAEDQVSGETCSLHLSYLTLEAATAAYAYAQARHWVHASAAMAPRNFQRVPLLHPPVVEHLESNPTAAGVAALRWYVVYAGIQPGIYGTFIESAINWIGVPEAAQESFVSLTYARAAFQRGISNGRIIRFDVV